MGGGDSRLDDGGPPKKSSSRPSLSLGRLDQLLPKVLQQPCAVHHGNRARIEVALGEAAPEAAQHVCLDGFLDALGNDAHAQFAHDVDHAADEDFARLVDAEPADEGAVDLYDINREIEQVRQRGKAGTEIVEGDENALAAQRLYRMGHDMVAAVHEHGLVDLEHDMLERHIGAAENFDNALGKVPALE